MRQRLSKLAEQQKLEDERHQFAATNAQLTGQVSELRHQLAAAQEHAADRDKELADAAGQLDASNTEREQLEVALQASQAELAAGATAEELERMAEVEGALHRAVKDYEILLRELTSLKAEAMHKDATIARLERGLHSATSQARSHQQEKTELEGVLTALEARMGDAALAPPPDSPPPAGLPSDHQELRAAAARHRTPSPGPFPGVPNAQASRKAQIREERLAMGMGASAPTASTPSPHPRSERMRVLPPTGFM